MTNASLSPHYQLCTWATTPLLVIKSGDYHPSADATPIMTMKVSKRLEFPVVALSGVGHMPALDEDEKEAARVFYVAATRATQRLVLGVGENGSGIGRKIAQP